MKTSQMAAMALIVFVAEMPIWANDADRSRPADIRFSPTVQQEIVVPVFMLFLGGVVQFGMIFWGQNTINQIVRTAVATRRP